MDDFLLELKQDFLVESTDLLETAEKVFIQLEKKRDSVELLNEMFRLTHNLKGTSQAVGFDQIAELTHVTENLILRLKEQSIELTDEVISTLLQFKDKIIKMVEDLKNNINCRFEIGALRKTLINITSGNTLKTSPDQNVQKRLLAPSNEQVNEQRVEEKTLAEINSNIKHNLDYSPISQKEPNSTQGQEKHSILLVDDEVAIIEILEGEIENVVASNIIRALNGSQAFEECKKTKFDVIISDYNMPHMNGEELIRSLRHGEDINKNTPVIMLTGFRPNFESNQKTWEKVFFLEKPFNQRHIRFIFKCAICLKVAE